MPLDSGFKIVQTHLLLLLGGFYNYIIYIILIKTAKNRESVLRKDLQRILGNSMWKTGSILALTINQQVA